MNDYETLGIVGEGAYGIVLKCTHKKTKEIVAIKKFKDKDTEDSLIKKVIIRELKALRSLKHQNIVHLRDAFRQNERLYLIFDFCDKSLLDLQEEHQNNGLPVQTIKSLMYQILKALEFMHERNFVHRDIKPENVLLTSNNKVKVCDFGFCRQLTKTDEILTDYVATRWYRSPELLITPKYTKAVDMWALGSLLGEMIDGSPMFPGDDLFDQLSRIYFMMGSLPETYRPYFEENQEFANIDMDGFFEDPEDFNPDYLRDRYLEISQSEELVDLLTRMLDMQFETRITAKQALNHPFFSVFREKENCFAKSKNLGNKIEKNGKLLKENKLRIELQTVDFVNTRNFGQTGLTRVEIKFASPSNPQKTVKNKMGFLPKIVHRNQNQTQKIDLENLKAGLFVNGTFNLKNK